MSTYSSATPDRLRKAAKTIIYAADQIEGLLRLADKDRGRIAELEAALREIADTKDSKDLGLDEPETYDDQNMIDTLICIARRALEGRHE